MSKDMEIQGLLNALLKVSNSTNAGVLTVANSVTGEVEVMKVSIDDLINELHQATNQNDFELMQKRYEADLELAYKGMVEAIISKDYKIAVDYGIKWQQLENQRIQNEVFLRRAKRNFKEVGHE